MELTEDWSGLIQDLFASNHDLRYRTDGVCLQLHDKVSRQPKHCRSAMFDPKGRTFFCVLGSLLELLTAGNANNKKPSWKVACFRNILAYGGWNITLHETRVCLSLIHILWCVTLQWSVSLSLDWKFLKISLLFYLDILLSDCRKQGLFFLLHNFAIAVAFVASKVTRRANPA